MTERDDLNARLEERVFSGEPFTFLSLHAGLDAAHRPADRLIQKLRRKGLIEFNRKGRGAIWTLTEAGWAERAARALRKAGAP